MAGAASAQQQPAEEPEGAKPLRQMQRDSKRLMRGVDQLATLDESLAKDEQQDVAREYERLLRCTKKLEAVLYESG